MTSSHRVPSGKRLSHRPARPYRILVASTGEPSSLGALRVASELARRKHATVQALTVATLFPHVTPSPFQAAPPILVDEDNRRIALDTVRRQLETVPGTHEWTLRSVTGWPPERILDAAEGWPASLLIIGVGDHGPMGRVIGSETAVQIAQRSKVPVLAVPEEATTLPTRAVAAIDFTESSIAAATLAATLLGTGGTLTLVHASVLIKQDPEPGSLPDVYTSGAMEKLERIRKRIQRATKRHVQTVTVDDDVAGGLLSYVERENCDLIAVGGHDQGILERLLFGSVRSRVLRHGHCQVLVAPHASPSE